MPAGVQRDMQQVPDCSTRGYFSQKINGLNIYID